MKYEPKLTARSQKLWPDESLRHLEVKASKSLDSILVFESDLRQYLLLHFVGILVSVEWKTIPDGCEKNIDWIGSPKNLHGSLQTIQVSDSHHWSKADIAQLPPQLWRIGFRCSQL